MRIITIKPTNSITAKIGLKIISNVLLLDAKIPTGIPIIIQKITAVNIIAKVVMLSDHKSTKSIKTKLKNVKIANFKPLVRYAKIIKIRIIFRAFSKVVNNFC